MLEETRNLDVDGVTVHASIGGAGPPVLLLHGYPQCQRMWHRVAPLLARSHTVVVTDLRGYGDSGKPAGYGDHNNGGHNNGGHNNGGHNNGGHNNDHSDYSKRAMAAEQVAAMGALGFDRFAVVGHDRGARVAHRMCLDHPERVSRVAMLDIAPSRHMFNAVDRTFALSYYHWFFLAQPADLPERLIGADPEFFLRACLRSWSADDQVFVPEAMAEYVRHFRDPATIHASCEDYRAGAGIDLEHDEADAAANRRIDCPVLVLWGGRGFVGRQYDVLDVWRGYVAEGATLRGAALDCGHFLPEEAPAATAEALSEFLRAAD